MPTVRLVSYNIRSMRDDRAALVRVVRRLRPDILCVQEAPRFQLWRYRRRWLARRAALVPVALRRGRVAGLQLYAGARATALHGRHRLLSPVPDMHQRGLALALFEVGGVRLVAASVHLDLAAEPRRRHAAEIIEELDRVRAETGAPVVVAGDVNEESGGAAWDLLAERFQDAGATAPYGLRETFSAANPTRRIDGVFADHGIEVLRCGVPDDPELLTDYPAATDHRPVLAELRVG
ncbi:endonuclease/exonuclease/phosphatase family protein [Actinoallomurus liliacearum]|uniref:Endonuclease/exonuclease/phosphatase family protein n=1 Tax=Actinoallomurus liliacearum TaxID=1080073 RepID=A0ABP8TPR6_9ACTN